MHIKVNSYNNCKIDWPQSIATCGAAIGVSCSEHFSLQLLGLSYPSNNQIVTFGLLNLFSFSFFLNFGQIQNFHELVDIVVFFIGNTTLFQESPIMASLSKNIETKDIMHLP